MAIRRIVVCEAQVPFVHGGAEYLSRSLVDRLREHGFEAELVQAPFKWYPRDELLRQAAAWRLFDLSESNNQPIDLCIATKFPTYFVRHPNKVVWLMHQYRAIYDLCGTPYSDFDHRDRDVGLRDTLMRLDGEMLRESRHVYTISKNTAGRLEKYNGIQGTALYPPPPFGDRIQSGPYGDYWLSVGRLEGNKRPDLAIAAMAEVPPPTRLIVVGDGLMRPELEALVEARQLTDRVQFAGAVDETTLIDLYREARGVVYVPYDEDYGFVTLEAFLARRPVVTVSDSGGPLEFVEPDVTGVVADPTSEGVAEAIVRLNHDDAQSARLGDAGYDVARAITWDRVIEELTARPGDPAGSTRHGD